MRPFTRSLDVHDYQWLWSYVDPIRVFQEKMAEDQVPHRDWHMHRFWEYGSVMQQLLNCGKPSSIEILDVGSGGCFFAPYLAQLYPNLSLTDSMKYGDINYLVEAQRLHYKVALPLYDLLVEDMSTFKSDLFDVTMCISTIEHVDADKHDVALQELWRITKPGGLIMITSDYFRDAAHFEQSISRHLQFTAYTKELVLDIPNRIAVDFVGETDLDYREDNVHNYSFCNICLKKRVV